MKTYVFQSIANNIEFVRCFEQKLILVMYVLFCHCVRNFDCFIFVLGSRIEVVRIVQ